MYTTNTGTSTNKHHAGVITPYTVNSETGALGQEITKLFTILRRLTAEGGASFGRVIDGDLRVGELGSWLQPTKADYYLQRLSVLLRQRKTAKVQGIVKRVQDALFGGPVAMMDAGIDDNEDRVQRMGELLANVIV